MNKFIKKQLDLIKGNISEYNEDTLHITVNNIKKSFTIGNEYIVKLDTSLFNSELTLWDNWNKGIKPRTDCLYIYVLDKMSNMIKCDAKDYINNEIVGVVYSNYWLPENLLTIVKEIAE